MLNTTALCMSRSKIAAATTESLKSAGWLGSSFRVRPKPADRAGVSEAVSPCSSPTGVLRARCRRRDRGVRRLEPPRPAVYGLGNQQGDDRLVGPAEAAHIRAMFVCPDWTRQGLGRAILEAGRDAARSEGFHRLDLMATLPGVPLYRAFGFRDIERAVLTMPDGVTIDAVAMERAVERL